MRPRWTSRARISLRPASRRFTTLGIETSCDDTCVALLTTSHSSPRATLPFHKKSTSDNRSFRGVYPPTALAGHASSLANLVSEALSSCPGVRLDLVAVTRGPGMSANLAEGLALGKGLSVAWGVPLVGVHHMQAHALTPRLVSALDAPAAAAESLEEIAPSFPFLTLLVSGGHTQLVHSRSLADHAILANSANIAIGDALDKCARLILPPDVLASCPDVMYARALEAFAFPIGEDGMGSYSPPLKRADEIAPTVSPHGWSLCPPLAATRRMAYEFAALESRVQSIVSDLPSISVPQRRDLAIDIMKVAFEHLVGRVLIALEEDPSLRAASTLVVSGGVACNKFLMKVLRSMLDARGYGGMRVVAPPVELCTDNAAMIAWAGWEMYRAGYETALDVTVLKKWGVDPSGKDGGILGVEGWKRRQA
ncbi:related to QRI7 - similarity to H.influenzae sialoglycoprotease (gcp) [Cephalotrichum gorgonifer]|uniref:N(6)-L-threonylcarbamoyladenine synthase n=1 Tax=Cephalotrichum gorgonifer TaxID=2041049 RepID=A0AAE8MQK1_9PEZI|nr:related to QRI7 - similarity to H.influenzae sialoglycoprotease (gcp) [Cephalotrichum gorgonifer]